MLNLLSVSIVMGFIILILSLCRKRLHQNYRAKVMCILWLVVAIRLLVPVQFGVLLHQPVIELDLSHEVLELPVQTQELPEIRRNHNMNVQISESVQNSQVQSEEIVNQRISFSLEEVLLIVWMTGAGIVVLMNLLSYVYVFLWLKKHCVQMKSIGNIKVYSSKALPESFAFGVFKPSVYLSEEFLNDEWVINHELTHCRHYDGLLQMVMCVVKILHWFNPMVYLMERQWDADREMYCDETVLKDKTNSERIDYMMTLYSAAESIVVKRLMFTSGLLDGGSAMKERFQKINQKRKIKQGRFLCVFLSLLIIMSSCMSGCSQKETAVQEDVLLKEMLTRVENEDMQISALILEGTDWQPQSDGSLLETYNKYTHSIQFNHPEYVFGSSDYVKKVLEKKGLLQTFYELNLQEIEQFTVSERDVVVRIIQDGMSIWFYDDGVMKLTVCLDSGVQKIKYYNVEQDSIKNLQNIVLEKFAQYWTKGAGLKEREKDPSLNEIWQIKQVLENDLETLKK